MPWVTIQGSDGDYQVWQPDYAGQAVGSTSPTTSVTGKSGLVLGPSEVPGTSEGMTPVTNTARKDLYYTVWEEIAKQAGVNTALVNDNINPEFDNWVAGKKAEGFDVAINKTPGYQYKYDVGFTQNGQPVGETKSVDWGQGLASSISGAIRELAPIAIAALSAGFAAPLASTLGVAQPVAAGLIGGGVTALGGGNLGDILQSGLTSSAGSYASNALAGGDSLLTPEMQATISSSPQGAFLGESTIPYPVTSPTVTSGVLPAIDPFADAVVDQVGNVISGSTGEVLIPAQAAAATGAGVNALADAMTGVDMSGNIVNSMTGEVIAPAGVTAGTAAAAAEAGAGAATDAAAGGDPTRAALYGDAGYGEGMTGGETTAYDTGLATGAAGTGAGAGAAGTTLGVSDALWGPIIGSIASLYGGSQAAEAAQNAARTQAEAIDRATQLQRDIYEKGVELQKPFYEGGKEAFNRLTALSTGGPEAAQNFLTMDPGYGFRLGEGMRALERLQASRGSLLSGGALKAGQRYAQDVASQEYGNAYNRLAQLADVGPRAAGVTSQLGQNYATSAGGLMGQSGVNSANALLTGAAARQSAYGDVGNIWGRYFGGGQ